MADGGSGSQTSKTVAEPAAEVKPYLKPYMEQASALSQLPYQSYTGQTVASQNPYQTAAYDMTASRALNGSPVQGMANVDAYKTLNGDYLNPASNPYLQDTYNMGAQSLTNQYNQTALPGVNSTFSLAGRYGSGAHENAVNQANMQLGSQLGNLATNIYGQNYANERQNQMNTMQFAPQLASADYADAQALLGAGDAQNASQTAQLQDAYQRWQQQMQYPYTQLDVLGNAIKTTMGAGGTTNVYGAAPSSTGQIVGAGLTGLGLLG